MLAPLCNSSGLPELLQIFMNLNRLAVVNKNIDMEEGQTFSKDAK